MLERLRAPGGAIVERTVRPDGVVIPLPAFDEHLGLPERVEDLAFEQLITGLPLNDST